MVKILFGAVIGGIIGFAAGYICAITGGACPILSNRIAGTVICALIGGVIAGLMAAR